MTSQGPGPHDWQWDDSLWGDDPAPPTTPEQVPEPDDGRTPGWLRRLLHWASRPA